MQRITIALDDPLAEQIDRLVVRHGYQNRSEAIRDLARAGLRQAAAEEETSGDCVAVLAYVYEHEARELSRRLTRLFHDHHRLSVSAMHVHLDQGDCLEVNVLEGPSRDVRHLAEHVIAERGVRHGQLFLVPAEMPRRHGRGGSRRLHMHIPKA